jgi:hypothetical protein
MIVIKNGKQVGCTPFYPGVLSGKRAFRAMDLSSARRYAWLCTVFHVAMIVAGVLGIKNDEFISYWSRVILFYIVVRIFLRRLSSISVEPGRGSYSLAPLEIWLDHFSCAAMLLFVVLDTNNFLLPPYETNNLLSIISVVFIVLVGFAPVWSYFVFRRRACR